MTWGIEIVTASECARLGMVQSTHVGDESIAWSNRLPVTERTWQHHYKQKMPGHPDPWWVDRAIVDDQFQGWLWVDEQLQWFEGHFPGAAILPGVVQLHWAVQVAQEEMAKPESEFKGMKQVKFKQPVEPGSWLKLVVTRRDNALQCTFSDGTATRTQVTLLYG